MIRTADALKLIAGLFAAVLLAAPAAAFAADGADSVIKVNIGRDGGSEALALPVGRSAVVDLPLDARDVIVTNPNIATAVLRTPRRIYVMGMKAGATDAMFFDAAGRRMLSLNIRVDQNVAALADTINRVLPGAHVHVESLNNSVVLSGWVDSLADSDRATQLAAAEVDDPHHVLNMLNIAGKQQVMLKVRVLEMNRTVIKQLGVNWQALINQTGNAQFLLNEAATYGVNGALLGGITTGGRYNNGSNYVSGSLQAFEREGLVRTLAEPNLTAVSGEAAKFLVGGEFPVPVSQDITGQVTVVFKEFGVGLGFVPVVLSSGAISLKLNTEVSEINPEGSFSLGNTNGGTSLVIPGLTVRRAQTTVEMPSGSSLMIAGLLQDKAQENLDALPGIKDLPILGALFRSRDYLANETELVIIVTPYLVDPTSPSKLQTPLDGWRPSSDRDTLLLGRLNKTYDHKPASSGRTYQGPYGYVVE